MKNQKLQSLGLAVCVTVGLTACSGLGKMIKNADKVAYTVTPSPLEMHGDSIAVSVSVKYPEKMFAKKAMLTVTPTLKYEGGEKAMKQEILKGEKAEGNGKTIAYKAGGSFTYTDKIAYAPGMEKADFVVKASAAVKSKTKEFPEKKIADGTIVTPLLVRNDEKPILGKDQFTKIIPRSIQAEIHYLVNSSAVRPTEMNDADVKAMKDFIKNGVGKKFEFTGISVSAYASPDGELTLNENLAGERAKTSAATIVAELKKSKVDAGKEGFVNTQTTAEDWDGFKSLMEASSVKDKDLIIRVLQMYSDPVVREREIKNLAATYVEVAEKILPQLRRGVITLNANEMSRTDEQISALVKSHPDSLSIEEILYAATLVNDLNEKLEIYKTAERQYPNDWRGVNNVGYICLLQNKLNDADAQFTKADGLSSNNPIIKNNLGIVARWKGDRKKATELYKAAAGAGKEVNYNTGIVNILDGDYTAAEGNLSGSNSFNLALAKVLNNNPDGASTTIDGSLEVDAAISYYLKAVIGARKANKDMVINNLKTAIQKDSSLKAKAAKDCEFLKLREDADFKAIVQ